MCKHESEDCITNVHNGIEQLQLEWTSGLDKSKATENQWQDKSKGTLERTGGLDKSKGALDVD
jgi:hypothetical protein